MAKTFKSRCTVKIFLFFKRVHIASKIIRHPQTSLNTHNNSFVHFILNFHTNCLNSGNHSRWQVSASLTQFAAIKQSFLWLVHARSFGKLPSFRPNTAFALYDSTGGWLPLPVKHYYRDRQRRVAICFHEDGSGTSTIHFGHHAVRDENVQHVHWINGRLYWLYLSK